MGCRNPVLSPDNFTQGHLMNVEWLVTDGTAVVSPDRGERAILREILAERSNSEGSHLVMQPPPS